MKYFEYIPSGDKNPNQYYIYYSKITGNPIEGFYNVDNNGNAWQGKHDQIYSVECDNVIENELNHSPYLRDRLPNETLTLPYSLNDIRIDVNSPVKASIFNNSLNKLYSNLIYIYSNSFVPNNYVPLKLRDWAGRYKNMMVTDDGNPNEYFVWQESNGTQGTEDIERKPVDFDYRTLANDVINMRLINNIREAVAINRGEYSFLFAITTTDADAPLSEAPFANRIICLRSKFDEETENLSESNISNMKLILNTQFIDDSASQDIDTIDENGGRVGSLTYINNLTYNKLDSIAFDGEKYLYVLDRGSGNIYMYDISNIINEDKLFKRRFMLVNIFGDQDATGGNNYKFIDPTIVRFINNQLMVFDLGDDSIKIFDKAFNWLGTMNNRNFQANKPVDIIYNDITEEYYILTRDAYILKYDIKFQFKEKVFSGIYLDNDEFCHKMYSSYNTSNICYVVTNRRIFKKFMTKLHENIGSFLFRRYQIVRSGHSKWNFNNLNWEADPYKWGEYDIAEESSTFLTSDYYTVNIKCMPIVHVDSKYDYIFVVINSRILYCVDNISYNTLLANDNNKIVNYYSDFDIYKLDDIYIKNEYVQSLTYNKALFKLAYNLNYLATKIIFKPVMEYDEYSNILIKRFDYIQNELLNLDDIKIYDNENIDVCVVNRIIERFYNFEKTILDNMQSVILNTKKSLNAEIIL